MRSIDQQKLDKARLLVDRLERLSADSIWAHRASGVRASLHKTLTEWDEPQDQNLLDALIEMGFDILHRAAQEVPDPDEGYLRPK